VLNQKKLQEVLDYDPLTGVMTWKIAISKARPGYEAGGFVHPGKRNRVGYWKIRIDGKRYKRAQLAWLHVNGVWAVPTIDHINANTLDDRIANLRVATKAQNSQNRRKPSHNKSGYKGVHRHRGRWRAVCRREYLGHFDTPLEASAVYQAVALQRYGKFHRV
jgi:hypothetical protein